LSHHIMVDDHQGELRCRSIVGVGTTFEIELPIQSAAICPIGAIDADPPSPLKKGEPDSKSPFLRGI
jgi:hypothetical protein